MNFTGTVGIYKYQHFGANILEIGPFLQNLLRKYEVLMGHSIALKTPKTCLVCDVAKMPQYTPTKRSDAQPLFEREK